MVFGCVPGTDPTANNGLAGRRPRRIHPHPRAHGHRENLGCVSLVHQSLNVRDFSPDAERCRVLYVSPIKALAVDVERNLRAPLIGISQAAQRLKTPYHEVSTAIRTGDTPPTERARFTRHPADILITTPESLYLLLTSNARETLRSVEVVVIDEIHALVPNKRGSHLALSIERLQFLTGRSLQRIGLSATQRPLEEVARYLGGALVSTKTTGGRKGGKHPLKKSAVEKAGAVFRNICGRRSSDLRIRNRLFRARLSSCHDC